MYKFETWPPEPERMERYRKYEELYRGEHEKAFAERINRKLYKLSRDGMKFLVLDYPKTIVDIPADLLVGAPPVISYDDADKNDALKRVMERSCFESVLLETGQDTGFRGDGVLVVRDSQRGVVIEPKPAYSYFPELHPDNCRDLLSEQLAWRRKYNGAWIVRVDRYLPGQVWREAYRLDGMRVGKPFTGAELLTIIGGPQSIPTGVTDRNTLVHIPNMRSSNEFLGRSDYDGGLPGLFEELDCLLTQISNILDRHAKPKMAGGELRLPRGHGGLMDLSELDYFEIPPGGDAPKYVTWDAQLIAAFQQYKILCDEIFRHAGICPVLAGYVVGARYDSGRAFRMQMAPTLMKVARKALYFDPAIKETLRIAVAMELSIPYKDVPAPNIRWRDGLPKDGSEASQTENNRIASKTTSRLDAIQRLDDCDEATALSIMERIELEQQIFGGVEMPPEEIQTPSASDVPLTPAPEESEDDA